MHYFDTTADAYDATQAGALIAWTGDTYTETPVRNGETLVIRSEGVIGICDTWPFSVTEESGKLHRVNDWTATVGRKGITLDCIRDAASWATIFGFTLAPALVAFLAEQNERDQIEAANTRRRAIDTELAHLGASLTLAARMCVLLQDPANRINGQSRHVAGDWTRIIATAYEQTKG